MKRPKYVFDDELYHHGIKGQKWGERRYQNEDGTWTEEGRERYGKGEDPIKKAKLDYKAEKYRMYLKSKEQKNKDKIAAKEEKYRIKQQAKNDRLLLKEQAKIAKKESGSKKVYSKDELKEKIEKLNLQIEYNKKLIEVEKPNSAMAKANRFLETPAGKLTGQVITSTIPNLITQSAQNVLNKTTKYLNPMDREKQQAEIDKVRAQEKASLELAKQQQLKAIPDNYEWVLDSKKNKFVLKHK